MSFPDSFLARMKSQLQEDYPAFLQSLEQPPPVSLRLHPLKNAGLFLESDKVPWHPAGRYLPERPLFTLDPAFHAGAYYVQEASSMFLYEALRQSADLMEHVRILDVCAAPGGKSTLILSELSESSFLLANEVIQSRLPALRMNLEKWGYPNVAVSNHDPADFQSLTGFFDVVLVDAPCSGEGLFRKDKAAAAAWSENNIALCAARQRRILAAARSFIRPGGVLIYSTCTFNTQENEENVGWLLGNGEFEEIRLTLDPAWGVSEESFGYRFYPHRVKGEGLYIACLRKTQGEKPRILKDAPFKDWQRLSPKLTNAFREWLSEPDRLEFFSKPNGEIVALPIDSLADMKLLDFALRKRSYGVMIGEMKRNDFIPSHALALSSLISNHLPSVELTLEEVLKFLKKENFHPDSTLKGWMLVKHKGLSLGWIKDLGNRINNYLPNEWRIRMDI